MNTNNKDGINMLLPIVPNENPKDREGNTLHDGDRVFSYDYFDGGYKQIYGTLTKSNDPKTFGSWCVDYDDGESFIVLSFDAIHKA